MLAPNVQADAHDQNSDVTSNPDLSPSPSVQFSPSQFSQLLGSLQDKTPVWQGSFSRCTERFDGSHNYMRVNAFVAAVSIFKDIESISDENALKGLPLLFEGHAAVWWRGVRGSISSWTEALDTIKATFAPRRPAYQVYTELFRTTQDATTPTDLFISRKRAQLAELANPHPETVQIDMVYGLLRLSLRKKIPRESIASFTGLIKRAREIEDLEKEAQGRQPQSHHRRTDGIFVAPYPRDHRRCNICRRPGHTTAGCHFRKNNVSGPEPTPVTTMPQPKFTQPPGSRTPLQCYGCGKPGFVRSKCPNCTKTAVPSTSAAFCTVSTTRHSRQRPAVDITIAGEKGQAFFDTGAKCSVASQSLYFLMKRKGHVFEERKMEVALADGNPRIQKVKAARMEVELRGRRLWTTFLVLPEGKDNRTLLGVDFIEDTGVVLNVPQRIWHFADAPQQMHDLQEEVLVGKAPFGEGETEMSSMEADLLPEIEEFARPLPNCLSPIREDTEGLQAFQREDNEAEPPVPSVHWPEIDDLFERCVRTFETKMDIATVDIGEDDLYQISPPLRNL